MIAFCTGWGRTAGTRGWPFAGGAGRGSHLAAGGAMTELDMWDNILCGQTVSLINMDVEGMEAEAIAGMAKTLRRHRPKLLIAGYHRSEDLWRLPLEVLAIQPEYKVYVRHLPLPASVGCEFLLCVKMAVGKLGIP